jgi:hypothetical protein
VIIKFQFKNSRNVTFRRTEGTWWKYMPSSNCNVGKEKTENKFQTQQMGKSTHKVKAKKNINMYVHTHTHTPYFWYHTAVPHTTLFCATLSFLRSWKINTVPCFEQHRWYLRFTLLKKHDLYWETSLQRWA